MSDKIFISYNHKDQEIVDNIAYKLSLTFGRENIFYDRWEIQPGDSIIGKMNEGLEKFTVFFYFVSKNSLESKMVALEWQSGLYKAVNNNLKFIAIKIDDCNVPAILANKEFLNLYNEGIKETIEKMELAVLNQNNYKPLPEFENLYAKMEVINSKHCKFKICAKKFTVYNPTIAFATSNSFDDFSVCFNVSDNFTCCGKDELTVNGNKKLNARTCQIQRALIPSRPFEFVVDISENCSSLSDIQLFILVNYEKGEYSGIQIQ